MIRFIGAVIKMGIQISAYNCESAFEKLIKPWIDIKDKYDIKIWVGSGQFEIYQRMGCENLNGPTIELFERLLDKGWIDYLFQPDLTNLLADHETRNKCIPWMRENDIDLMIQLDADEFYSTEDVENYLNFIINNQLYDSYNTIFRNSVSDIDDFDWSKHTSSWIKRHGGISHYYFDAHFSYVGKSQFGIPSDDLNIEYRRVTNIEVPKELVNPIHYTWNSENRTTGPIHIKEKIEYQNIYYGGECGYVWDEKENKLTKI